jgi:alanine racemase
MLGVAMVEEGAQLRAAGLRLPVLIQCCAGRDEIEYALEHELSLTVPSLEFAQKTSEIAARMKATAAIHVDIDTGMGRIGFAPDTAADQIVRLSQLPHLKVDGAYTHFCVSEKEGDDSTANQLKRFKNVIDELAARGINIRRIHAANSGAVLNHPQSYLTLVRPGLILYGVYPDVKLKAKLDLKPVMKWKTEITFLKTIQAGTTLGYGRTFTAPSVMRIATANVGYADGYSWRLSNKASVLVRGRRLPVVGRVSMDQLLFDVTAIPDVEPGEEVVLLGQDGSERITAEELAHWADTIPYEILCGVSKRVPRVYMG